MKNLIAFAVVAASFAAFADAQTDIEEGGRLDLWPQDHGRFLFVNAQKSIETAQFKRPVAILAGQLNFDIALVSGEAPDIRAVKAELTKLGAKGAVWIVDDPAYPLVLGACEDGWAFLNIAPMIADRPDAQKLAMRIEKMVNRTFANIHGIGDSQMMPQCVMKTAVGLDGIDKLICREYSPEPLTKIGAYMIQAGYKHGRHGTYYDACEGGWAPAPTNDVQRKIWDEVHQLPTKPIKILPPGKQKK